jgi:hypothetical protein
MFNGAISVNQDLCPWDLVIGDPTLPVRDMFANTKCSLQTDPFLRASATGPFGFGCSSCWMFSQLSFFFYRLLPTSLTG